MPVRAPVCGALLLALVAIAWVLSASPLESDDLHFMTVALSHLGDPSVIADRTAWFQHQRPGFHAAWWLLAPLDTGGGPVRALLALLWVASSAGLMRWAHRRQGWTGVALVGLGLVPWGSWLELLTWRSWLTSMGTTSGLVLGLWALRTERTAWFVLAMLWAAAFKETGPFALGLAALFSPQAPRHLRGLGAVSLALAIALGSVVTSKLAPSHVPDNAMRTVASLAPLSWLAGVALVRWRPSTPGWLAAVVAAVGLIPGPLGGVAGLLGALALAGWWAPVLLACWALASVGLSWHPVYLVEGGVLAVFAVVSGPRLQVPRAIWPVMLVSAVWLNAGRGPQLAHQAERARHQQEFLAWFDPEPAASLYFSGPSVYELDVLVWLRGGATLEGRAPPGRRPVQVGPLSGVWADLAPPGEGIDPRSVERWQPSRAR